jgi:hypothetical protein
MKPRKRNGRARRVTATRRTQLLADFEQSGLSAAAFARQHQIRYTTFCGWRTRRSPSQRPPPFVEVELAAPATSEVWVVELGGQARVRLQSPGQIALAAQLLGHLNPARPC